MLTLLTLLVACFGQLDVVRSAVLLDSLEDNPERVEIERQTNAFLASVMQSILPIVAKSNLRLITGLLGLLLDRSNVTIVARTKVRCRFFG
jgi:DNA topoisomerase 2-associated protein PAT1